MHQVSNHSPTFACNMNAIPPGMRHSHSALVRELFGAVM